MLLELIRSAQAGNQNDMLLLIQKFAPILKKYGGQLKREDGINDMVLYFIELIYQVDTEKMASTCDGALVNYIAKCIYRFFLKLSEKAHADSCVLLFEDLPEPQKASLAATSFNDDTPFEWVIPINYLTENERMIIDLIYKQGYSSAEIANQLGINRQSVNQTKKRAEAKIRRKLYI